MFHFFLISLFFSNPSALENRQAYLLETENLPAVVQYLASHHYDIAGVDGKANQLMVVMTPSQWKNLKSQPHPPWQLVDIKGSERTDISPYTDPAEMAEVMDELASLNPEIAKVVVLGNTVEGRPILAMKISDHVEEDEDEPVFLLDALHHAREVMTAEIARDAMEYLILNYPEDEKVKTWVDHVEIWIIPIVNPDGHAYVFQGHTLWRKNKNPVCPVDINRNYSATFNSCYGSSDYCYAEDYRGEKPASERETQAVQTLAEKILPAFYLSYHSFGEYIIWPYGCTYPDRQQVYQAIAQELNAVLKDDLGNTDSFILGTSFNTLYVTDGTSDDHIYARTGALSYTIEVNSSMAGGFQPDYALWRDRTVEKQRTAWQFFLDYLTQGPLLILHLLDEATDEPIPGAFYTLEEDPPLWPDIPWQANAQGTIYLPGIKNSTYTLTISAYGYDPWKGSLSIGEGPSVHTIYLSRRSSGLEGVEHLEIK